MLGHYQNGRFVPNFNASFKAYGAFDDDDDEDDRPKRERQRASAPSASRRSINLADVVGDGATPAKTTDAKPNAKDPLIVRAIKALTGPKPLSKWTKIGMIVVAGVAVVGGMAYFEEQHYAKLRLAGDGEDEKDEPKSKSDGKPKWKKVG